ncbi:MAG: hypothetical protein Q9163_003779 [Psora crenata]
MACGQAKPNIKNNRRRSLIPKDQGKPPQGIKKEQAVRKSLRLQSIQQSYNQSLSKSDQIQEVQALLSPPANNIPESRKRPRTLLKPSTSSRKRKRGQENQEARQPSSRSRASPSSYIDKKKSYQTPASNISEGSINPLKHWIKTGKWRKEYFEQDSQVKEDFERGKSPKELGRRDSLQEHYEPFRKMYPFNHLQYFFAKKKSSASLRRKQSQLSLQTPSDQPSREGKSSQYNTPDYEIRLEGKGSYMREYDDIDNNDNKGENIKILCKTLLERDQIVPQDSLFRDDLFKKTCEKVRNRNKAIVVQDIGRLIVPSAENLAIYGAKHLNYLYETANESWTSMAEYEGTLPQPDYSVGFGRSAFTWEQLDKLKPWVGEPGSKLTTYFMATTRMYFPFFTCEVKCGAAALDVADRQNTQSMSIALRALIVLFRSVKREKELDREILTFSVSHDHRSVRIYGHYPVIEVDKTTFYRHPIRQFYFTDGEEKWTAYKFTKSVYDTQVPKLHKLLCSAIDDLPTGISFDLSQSASFSQSISQSSQQSNTESVLGQDDITQETEPAFKKPRNQRAGGQQR